MFIHRFMLRLRIALIIIFIFVGITVIGGIIYLNHNGLNEDIRGVICKKLAEKDMHVQFDSLSYNVKSGLVAENVTVYGDRTKKSRIASLPSIHINLDKTKLFRGIHKIDSLSLIDGRLEIPLDPKRPNGTRAVLDNINGKIEFPDNSSITTDSLTATYEGIDVHFKGNLWKEKRSLIKPDPEAGLKRAIAYETFLKKLAHWDWPEGSPPQLNIYAEGDIYDPQHIKLKFQASAPLVIRKEFKMIDAIIKGELSHNIVSIDSFKFKNQNKGNMRSASLSGDIDLASKRGHFRVDKSDIHLKRFIIALFDKQILKGTKFKKSEFTASGEFKLEKSMTDVPYASALPSFLSPFEGNKISVIGKATLNEFNHLGSDFDSVSSDFSYNSGDLYLDELTAKNKEGTLNARLLIKDKKILFDVESTLPFRAYKPFFKENLKLSKQLAKINFKKDSSVYFKSDGEINADDLTDWNASGIMALKKFTYDGQYQAQALDATFNWKDRYLTTNVKLSGLQLGGMAMNEITTSANWSKGILSLNDVNIKDKNIQIGQINSNVKQDNGSTSGNITIKKANLNGFTFEQLDTRLQTSKEGTIANINVTKPIFRNQPLDHIKAHLLYNKKLALDKIDIKHSTGTIIGSASQNDDGYVYFDLLSTLNPHLYLPLIKAQKTKDIILTAQLNPLSTYSIGAKGRINLSNLKDWQSAGNATASNFKFNNVPLKKLVTQYDLSPKRMVIDNGNVIFDYKNYSPRKSSKAKASQGELSVDRVIVDFIGGTVVINNAYGKAYPAPVARMFHKESADHIEEYKFFSPPEIRAAGIFDTIPRAVKDRKINFRCNLACPDSSTMYSLLDGNLLLQDLKANVHIYKNVVNVEKLSCSSFRGPIKGAIKVMIPDTGDASYEGKFNFLKLNFRDIGVTYNFDEIPKGEITGNLHFTGKGDNIRNFNSTGNISLDKGNIFSAPVLGPISLILNPLLPKKGHLNERLKNMSANFTIQNGVLRTDNTQSLTPSMTFTGAGWVDLKTDKMDVTIRINYRGLIGLTMQLGAEIIRLPVQMLRALFLNKKPDVAGLLQVRGTGLYKDPKWRAVNFDVARGFKGKLFNPPKAIIVP